MDALDAAAAVWLLTELFRQMHRFRMKSYHINILYSEEDQGYIADIPDLKYYILDLKYCSAFGETEEEALQEALKAKTTWL